MSRLTESLKVSIGNSRLLERLVSRDPRIAPGDRLIVHLPNHLGDAVMSIPLIHSLTEARLASISLLCLPEHAALWRNYPGIESVLPLPRVGRENFRACLEAVRGLAARHSILLATGEEIAWLHLRAGVRNRIGYDFWGRGCLLTWRKRSGGSPIASELVSHPMRENYLDLARLIGIVPRVPQAPWLEAPVGGELPAGLEGGIPIVSIAPFSNQPERSLPLELWKEVLAKLGQARRFQALLLGAASLPGWSRQISEAAGIRVVDAAGSTDLSGLMRCLAASRLLIGPDSGAPHLAAALGTPCVSIFTAGSPRWTAPFGGSVRTVYQPVACSPCFGETTCRGAYHCRNSIDASLIASAAEGLLG